MRRTPLRQDTQQGHDLCPDQSHYSTCRTPLHCPYLLDLFLFNYTNICSLKSALLRQVTWWQTDDLLDFRTRVFLNVNCELFLQYCVCNKRTSVSVLKQDLLRAERNVLMTWPKCFEFRFGYLIMSIWHNYRYADHSTTLSLEKRINQLKYT